MVKDSPSDAELAAKSDFELVAAAVRCADLDGVTYCLQLGWMEEPPTRAELREMVDGSAAMEGTGDMSLGDKVRAWARLPWEQRLAQDREQLADALAGLDKVKRFRGQH